MPGNTSGTRFGRGRVHIVKNSFGFRRSRGRVHIVMNSFGFRRYERGGTVLETSGQVRAWILVNNIFDPRILTRPLVANSTLDRVDACP